MPVLTVTLAAPPGSANGFSRAPWIFWATAVASPPARSASSRITNALAEPLRHRAEHQVADVMSAGVVDPLEPVKIDEEDREAGRESLGPDQELVQPVEHEIAVRQTRERVVGGDVLHGDLSALEFVDLSGDTQQPHDGARRVMERHLARQGPVDLAALELAALRQADERLVRLHDSRVVQHGPLGELLAEQVRVSLADELRRIRVTEVPCHLPAHAQEPA